MLSLPDLSTSVTDVITSAHGVNVTLRIEVSSAEVLPSSVTMALRTLPTRIGY